MVSKVDSPEPTKSENTEWPSRLVDERLDELDKAWRALVEWDVDVDGVRVEGTAAKGLVDGVLETFCSTGNCRGWCESAVILVRDLRLGFRVAGKVMVATDEAIDVLGEVLGVKKTSRSESSSSSSGWGPVDRYCVLASVDG